MRSGSSGRLRSNAMKVPLPAQSVAGRAGMRVASALVRAGRGTGWSASSTIAQTSASACTSMLSSLGAGGAGTSSSSSKPSAS
jgi:uncharacterized membrane protein SpoIIM required for sporulation